MKVTVCFGSVRIVVPCGSGDLLVKDLIHEATRRYKKAVGKEPDSWVAVHHLQTQSGILDPDDCLRDVADDREQILASFEDSGPDPGVPQGGGDGASGSSSVGTGSPDIFRDPTNTDATTGNNPNATIPHIEVTSTTAGPMTGLGLQVRRSSDPNLLASLANQSEANKRWSAAAPACRGDSPERIMDKVVYLSPQWEEEDDIAHQSPQPQQTFARSGRLSMQFLGDGNGYKWMEAAEKLQTQNYSTKSLPRETGKRKEPLGQAYESIREKDGEMLLIINEYGGPLGLTAIPDSENGGLIVQHVEVGSRAERGRLRRGDRILEINGTKLIGLSEGKVQDHLRRSLESSELRVRVIRGDKLGQPSRRDSKVAEMIEAEEKASSAGTKVATVSPTRKSHTAPVGTSLQVANTRKLGRKIEIILKKGPHGLGFSVTTRDNPAGGHCPIYIKNILPRGAAIEDGRLKPGDRLLEVDGIPMTGKTQSDVVSILRSTQPGATVRIVVSRQQELVEVDEREINFSEEQELATSTPPKPPPPVLPSSGNDVKKSSSSRSLFEQHQQQQQAQLNESQHFIDGGSESAASADSLQAGIAWRSREVLTLHIPVHDTEKAGLGVSVKGKTNSSNSSSGSNGSVKHDGDLGIFVKNVIHGGAASRDGRLRMNDQLLSVNGVSLLGQSNAEAMETLRRAMVNTPGKHPGVITLSVARKITRSHSSGDILENTNDSSNTSENSGATVIYLSPDKKDNRDMNRWSNPVLDRLTGGVCSSNSNQNRRPPPPLSNTVPHGLRNDSYYMATNDTWSPALQPSHMQHMGHVNNSVLIEDDPEPMSPTLPHRPNDSVSTQQSTTSNGGVNFDATYSSQLSLETNNSGAEHFSRDAIGRRSISEKHHAALDARETGTYQRNKKLREDRERERRLQLTKSAVFGGSVESLSTRIANANHQMASGKHPQTDLRSEALDQLGELGPSLGLKKSSSLESLQTMVQEIQMSDEPRGPSALRAPRGRGREDSLRAAVVEEHDKNKPRKHWLLEEADSEGGFPNRNGPFQSSLNDGKHKSRAKKPSILRGIGHMFRFGKNRKDGVVPMDAPNDYTMSSHLGPQLPPPNGSIPTAALSIDRGGKIAPPIYQPPPPPPPTSSSGQSNTSSNASSSTAIHHNDIFNHRYQHYANYEDLQQHQLSDEPSKDVLSESTLECMRQQVIRQRNKVEAESRRHQHYHSQRSTRSPEVNIHQSHIGGPSSTRPASSYYEYETVQHNVSRSHNNAQKQQHNLNNNIPTIAEQKQQQQRHWKAATLNGFSPATLNSSGRSRGPFVTQVTIRDQTHLQNSSSSHATAQQPTYQQVHKSHHQNAQPHASKV